MSKTGFVITIDGPAASGKGTIVQMLTEFFDGINIYTGGMYRALALKCIQNKVSFEDQESVEKVLSATKITLGEESNLGKIAKIYLDGKDVTGEIKNPLVGIGAGKVATLGNIRSEMARKQFEIAEKFIEKKRVVVLDGQDAALIYPNAKFKIFLNASQEVRAKRRKKQYEKQGLKKSYESVLEEIKDRDNRDWSRKIRPLSKDPVKDGYLLIDSSGMNEAQTFDKILKVISLTN